MQVARFRSKTSTDRLAAARLQAAETIRPHSPMNTPSRSFATAAIECRNVGNEPFVGFLSGIVLMSLTTQRRQNVQIDVGKLCRLRAEEIKKS
jgi:hypothetical protein